MPGRILAQLRYVQVLCGFECILNTFPVRGLDSLQMCNPSKKESKCNPSTSGSTAIRLLMKSHPITVSSDHRGVFGALTGPMRAPIWPCPHESEWAVERQDLSLRGYMQMVLIRLSEMISSAAGGSEHNWEEVQKRERGRKKSKDRHSQPVWEDVRHTTGISMWLQVGRESASSWDVRNH